MSRKYCLPWAVPGVRVDKQKHVIYLEARHDHVTNELVALVYKSNDCFAVSGWSGTMIELISSRFNTVEEAKGAADINLKLQGWTLITERQVVLL